VATVVQYRRWGSDGKVVATIWLVNALISESIRMIEASGVNQLNQKGILIRKSKYNRCGRNSLMEHGSPRGFAATSVRDQKRLQYYYHFDKVRRIPLINVPFKRRNINT